MGQTVRQIEAHIDTTRERLGANLQELERRVDAATDWRSHFRTRPFTLLGVAFAGGVFAATTVRGRPGRRAYGRPIPATTSSGLHAASDAQKYQALEMWDQIKGALIGVVATRFKDYLGKLIPGFDEQFQRAERTAGSFRGNAKSQEADPPDIP
jgi:hypothetical protein